jgi:hypothetical protein
LGINKPTGCGGHGLNYKFQVENSVNKKGWSFGHQQAHWLWRPGAGLQIPGRKINIKKAGLLGIKKPTGCGIQGLNYKFHVEKSNNKKGWSFGQ